jgi:hypothetical protein
MWSVNLDDLACILPAPVSKIQVESESEVWLIPQQVDLMYQWPRGRAARLARAGKLPGHQLPDGSIRFKSDELLKLNKPTDNNQEKVD